MNLRCRAAVWPLCALACGVAAIAMAQPRSDPLAQPRTPRPAPADIRTADAEVREMIEGSATMSFDYEEDIPGEPAEEPRRGGGGIVGKINEVAEAISADQGRADTTDSAHLRVRLVPVLARNGDEFVVTLRVAQERWWVGTDLPAASRAAVEADRAAVSAQLSRWKRVLTPEQVTTLRESGALTLAVRERFTLQRLRGRDQPVVTIYLLEDESPDVARVVFIVRTKSGVQRASRLVYGCVTVAEVTLDRAPTRDEPIPVRISVAGRVLDLTASPTAPGSATLRTEPFVPVVPQDIEGLDPPSIPSQPGDVHVGVP